MPYSKYTNLFSVEIKHGSLNSMQAYPLTCINENNPFFITGWISGLIGFMIIFSKKTGKFPVNKVIIRFAYDVRCLCIE